MAVVSALSPLSLTSYFDPNTGAAMQVDLYFYKGNTLDPLPVYADAGLSVLHPVPLPTTGNGRVPPVFIGELPDPGYRVRAFNQWSELVEDLDNLPGAVVPDGGGGGEGPVQPTDPHLLKTGDYVFSASGAIPREGCVLANGLTIGSATSSATGRANADAEALFKKLWGADTYGLLPVLPSRGASANGDWLANKAITLPNLQCRMLVGMDGMGVTPTNALNGVPMQAGTPDKLFATGGTALVTLTTAMMPTHRHTLADPGHAHTATVPAHGHAFYNGSTSASGDHTHTGYTDVQGAHAHNYSAGDTASNYGGGPSVSSSPPVGKATDVQGAHQHNVQTYGAGNHGHAVYGNITDQPAVGIATTGVGTGITMADTGDGGAHNNTPLFLTAAVYLVL